MEYIRNNEVEAKFNSTYGFPIMQIELQALEQLATAVYSREVFFMFHPMLKKASIVKVVDWKDTT